MKRATIIIGLFLVLILFVAAAASAIQTGPVRGDRIGIVETPERMTYGVDGTIRRALPGYLEQELRRAGFAPRIVGRAIEQLEREPLLADDFYVEVAYSDASGGAVGGVGTGGVIGTTGIGAEVSVVVAAVNAEVRLYDARTMQLVDTFVLSARNVSPAVTGVGLGDRHGYFYLELPFFRNEPFRRAAREIARDAATRISGRPLARTAE